MGAQAAAMRGQSMVGQAGAGAVGEAAMSWTQPQNPPPGMPSRPGAPPPQGPQAAAMRGQSMVGQAGAGAVGEAAMSWMQPQNAPPGMPPRPGAAGAPPPQGAQAAALRGQTMVGQAGAGAVGDASVSWHQRGPVPPLGGAGATAASLMGQAGAGAVGDASISWNQNANVPQGAQAAAMRGQSMVGQAGAQAVGEASVSWVQQPGVMGAAPGAAGVSQMGAAIQAPGQGARSMIDGTMQAVPGQGQSLAMPGQQGPGAGAVSQLGPQAGRGAPGVSQMAAAAGAGQPGQSMRADAAGAAAPGVSQMAPAAVPGVAAQPAAAQAQPGTMGTAVPLEIGESTAKLDEKGASDKAPATLVAGAAKTQDAEEAVAAEGDEKPLWSGPKDDEELVDPDADRPDFGSAEEPAEEEDEEEDDDEEDGEDEEKKKSPAVVLKPERQIDPAYITAGLMVVAVGCVAMMLWLQRDSLSRMWPGFDAIYSKLGLAEKKPGDGLRLTQSGMRLLRIGGIETLVVKGYISNIASDTINVPQIRLQLIDGKNMVVQETQTPPTQSNLAPNASIDFEVRLELPNMAAAKSVVVNWAE